MPHIAVIGAGITGVTMASKLLDRGFDVTVIERNSYAAMETSFANGGQLSASNAEVWNSVGTVLKGLKWLAKKDAPLSMNLSPSWHKYSWLAEFVAAIPNHEKNTVATAKMAMMARHHLLAMAAEADIDFDVEHRGILHFYKDAAEFEAGRKSTKLLEKAGVFRREVSADEARKIEPTLPGNILGGFFTEGDFSGDIHKFSIGLEKSIRARGAKMLFDTGVSSSALSADKVALTLTSNGASEKMDFDAVVVSAGVGSRAIAAQFGDRVNVYPVKGYSITVDLDETSAASAPWVSLLDEKAKIVTSRLGASRFRVAGTAEFNGTNYDIRADRIKPLTAWVKANFPEVCTRNTTPWAGLRPMMPNMMPRLGAGRNPRVFYNTGHGHLGWTLSAATAEIVANTVETSFAAKTPTMTGGTGIFAKPALS